MINLTITNPIDLLKYVLSCQDYGQEVGTVSAAAKIKLDGDGGFNSTSLDPVRNIKIRFQVSEFDKSYTDELIKKICSQFSLIQYTDSQGFECVKYLFANSTNAPVFMIDQTTEIDNFTPPDPARICHSPVIKYNYDYASNEYQDQLSINNVQMDSYSSGYTSGFPEGLGETYWNLCKEKLFPLVRHLEEMDTSLSENEFICDIDGAIWRLNNVIRLMKSASFDFTVPFEIGIRNNLKAGDIIGLRFDCLYSTTEITYNAVISSVSLSKNSNSCSISTMLLSDLNEEIIGALQDSFDVQETNYQDSYDLQSVNLMSSYSLGDIVTSMRYIEPTGKLTHITLINDELSVLLEKLDRCQFAIITDNANKGMVYIDDIGSSHFINTSAASTANKLVKFLDNYGVTGDSIIGEYAGKIGIGTSNPNELFHVHGGEIMLSDSITGEADGMRIGTGYISYSYSSFYIYDEPTVSSGEQAWLTKTEFDHINLGYENYPDYCSINIYGTLNVLNNDVHIVESTSQNISLSISNNETISDGGLSLGVDLFGRGFLRHVHTEFSFRQSPGENMEDVILRLHNTYVELGYKNYPTLCTLGFYGDSTFNNNVCLNSLTANRAIYLDLNKRIAVSSVTNTELGYLSGVTSAIQPQINSKMSTASYPDLVAIENIAGTSGLLRKTASNAWGLDTNVYLTGNQNITLSGIITGSGTTAITTAIADNALSIAKTTGLQIALDSKMTITSYPDLVAIENLSDASGFLKKTTANTWALDTNTYWDKTTLPYPVRGEWVSTITDLNLLNDYGRVGCYNIDTNAPNGWQWYNVISPRLYNGSNFTGAEYGGQFVWEMQPSTVYPRAFLRTNHGDVGSWGNWCELWTTGNFNPNNYSLTSHNHGTGAVNCYTKWSDTTGNLTSTLLYDNGQTLAFTPMNTTPNYSDGLRIGRSPAGYSLIALGALGYAGTQEGQWTIYTVPSFANYNLILDCNASAILDIATNGNIGIGSTLLNAKLDFGSYFVNKDSGLTLSELSSTIKIWDDGTNSHGFGASLGSLNYSVANGSAHRFWINALEMLNISSTQAKLQGTNRELIITNGSVRLQGGYYSGNGTQIANLTAPNATHISANTYMTSDATTWRAQTTDVSAIVALSKDGTFRLYKNTSAIADTNVTPGSIGMYDILHTGNFNVNVQKLWSTSHPANYYLTNDWRSINGVYRWRIVSNHGDNCSVAHSDLATNATYAGALVHTVQEDISLETNSVWIAPSKPVYRIISGSNTNRLWLQNSSPVVNGQRVVIERTFGLGPISCLVHDAQSNIDYNISGADYPVSGKAATEFMYDSAIGWIPFIPPTKM